MYSSCLEKQDKVKALFSHCTTAAARYEKIMELGSGLRPLPPEAKIEENRVKGCQSLMYLSAKLENGQIIFEADSDALISRGLAVILLLVYSGETAEAILKCPPTFLDELGIAGSLTPGRANGLFSLHLKMKQEALRLLLASN